jgi:hypothetical protein
MHQSPLLAIALIPRKVEFVVVQRRARVLYTGDTEINAMRSENDDSADESGADFSDGDSRVDVQPTTA